MLSCSNNKGEPAESTPVDTMNMMVTQIQKCSRLYTAEYKIHKIITHSDNVKVNGSFLKRDFSIDLPVGERRIAIPMTATIKAYVDMEAISAKDIRWEGGKITVILPDPQIVMTSTKISNEEIKQHVALIRRNFSDEELVDYARQGRDSIVAAIPRMGIIENARASAARAIIPLIVQMGFTESDITVTFRKDFTGKDFRTLLVNTVERNGKAD